MRIIPTGLKNHLQGGGPRTVCFCTKIVCLNGALLGFTSHDRDLMIDGVRYEAETSQDASTMRQTTGTGIDNLDIIGLISSPSITEIDLAAGKFDGATVEIFLVNYLDSPIVERLIMLKGFLGELEFQRGVYKTEVRSLMQRLSQQIGDLTSMGCRVAALFDKQCSPVGSTTPTATPADWRFTRSVVAIVAVDVFRLGADTHASGYFDYGRVVFNTGNNAAIEKEIKQHTLDTVNSQALIQVCEPFPYSIAISDQCMVEVGCNRLFPTCRDKFANEINFRGEPHIPGNDAIIQIGRK